MLDETAFAEACMHARHYTIRAAFALACSRARARCAEHAQSCERARVRAPVNFYSPLSAAARAVVVVVVVVAVYVRVFLHCVYKRETRACTCKQHKKKKRSYIHTQRIYVRSFFTYLCIICNFAVNSSVSALCYSGLGAAAAAAAMVVAECAHRVERRSLVLAGFHRGGAANTRVRCARVLNPLAVEL